MDQFEKLRTEDRPLEQQIADIDASPDHHTYDIRQKKKGLQERRSSLEHQMPITASRSQEGTKAMQNLLQSAESDLELAKFAETWEWKEADWETFH